MCTKKEIHFKHSNTLEFILVCPYCDDEEGCYGLKELLKFGNSYECGNCLKSYPIIMENIQYHIKKNHSE
jgi:hypothetical protein